MRTAVAFHKCSEVVEAEVQKHWPKQETRLRDLLGPDVPADTQLDLLVHHEPEAERYAVRAVLPLPSATLTAEVLNEHLVVALEHLAGILEMEIRTLRGGEANAAEILDAVEAASADSFPASDPPSWTPLTASGPPVAVN